MDSSIRRENGPRHSVLKSGAKLLCRIWISLAKWWQVLAGRPWQSHTNVLFIPRMESDWVCSAFQLHGMWILCFFQSYISSKEDGQRDMYTIKLGIYFHALWQQQRPASSASDWTQNSPVSLLYLLVSLRLRQIPKAPGFLRMFRSSWKHCPLSLFHWPCMQSCRIWTQSETHIQRACYRMYRLYAKSAHCVPHLPQGRRSGQFSKEMNW